MPADIATGVTGEHECGDRCVHKSDCAIHNAPAEPAGPCSCGTTLTERQRRLAMEILGALGGVEIQWPND